LPRLWATRKVGYLLNQIRLKGPEQETIDQIVKLSIRYGIVTPYTSYLVTEPMPLGAANQRQLSQDSFQQALAAPTEAFGAGAVNKAAEQGELARSDIAASLPAGTEQLVKAVGARTFVRQNGVWIDTAYDPDKMTPTKVSFASKDYFALADTRPDIAAALALGQQVILVIDSKAYEVVSSEEVVAPLNLPTSTSTPAASSTPPPQSSITSVDPTPTTQTTEKSKSLPGFCVGSYIPAVGVMIWFGLRKRNKSN
jgi:Ca-activated chloride channel family protein